MIKSILNVFRLRRETKDNIKRAESEREKIKGVVAEIVRTLNGEDRWFIRVCDSLDDERPNCVCGKEHGR